jgi:hypothetical protein
MIAYHRPCGHIMQVLSDGMVRCEQCSDSIPVYRSDRKAVELRKETDEVLPSCTASTESKPLGGGSVASTERDSRRTSGIGFVRR